MSKTEQSRKRKSEVSRRDFVMMGGVTLAGGAATSALANTDGRPSAAIRALPNQSPQIQSYRTLGRTGWQVSDISMGTGPLRESALVRAAFDKGINYFDTAESYTNGGSERAIGEALPHIGRENVFIATKAVLQGGESEAEVVERIRKCLERLNTDYIDAFSMHWVPTIEGLNHPGYHAAIATMKAEGRVRFTGLSYHGPMGPEHEPMVDVLSAAGEDGRFDMMLLVYNFLNREDGDRIVEACKTNDVGTTVMKSAPGILHYEPFDPDNLTEQETQFVERMTSRGSTREAAIERLQRQADEQQQAHEGTLPFVERYGLRTEDQLRLGSIQWVLQNPDLHTVCVSLNDFDNIDRVVELSGRELTTVDEAMLDNLERNVGSLYCRHGCVKCSDQCPNDVPVSTIMRYAYYFDSQGREKHAMGKYAKLNSADGSACSECSAPCSNACPYGVQIQAQMFRAHSLLTLG